MQTPASCPPSGEWKRTPGKLRGYAPLLWLLAFPALNTFYAILNHDGSTVYSLATDLDAQIPFLPIFIIPYLFWYPFIFGMIIVLFAKHRSDYYRTLIVLCAGLIGCYLTYAFYQTSVPRPQLDGQDHLFVRLVRLVYAFDGPYNCFPSIHVLTTYITLKGAANFLREKRWTHLCARLIALSIVASTVLVKQHVLLDIVGAIILAELLFLLMHAAVKFSENKRRQKQHRGNEKQAG